MMTDIDRIREAMQFIPVGGNHERWRVAAMIHSELGEAGRDLWNEWRGDRARDYFTGRAAAQLPKPDPYPDDRRTCGQCANLIARRCVAARRGEIVASRDYEPIRDLPRRCEGYAPGADDPDRRHGHERWPGLRADNIKGRFPQ